MRLKVSRRPQLLDDPPLVKTLVLSYALFARLRHGCCGIFILANDWLLAMDLFGRRRPFKYGFIEIARRPLSQNATRHARCFLSGILSLSERSAPSRRLSRVVVGYACRLQIFIEFKPRT